MAVVAILVGVLVGSAITTIYSRRKASDQSDSEDTVEPSDGTRSMDPEAASTSRSLNNDTSSSLKGSMSAYAAAVSQSQGGGLLTGIMAQLWSHMNVAIAKSVKETVEPMFKEMLPGPLASLHFTQLDLGSVPIRMDNIIVHDQKDDAVQFDFDISWDGDCSIELKADYVGSFGIRKVKLFGRMSVLLAPLSYELPVVGAVQICFMNAPTIELDFTGLANLADCSLLDSTVRSIIQDTLASMMVLPNRMLSKLDPAVDFMDAHRPPLGICRITAVSGENFKEEKGMLSTDVPDVYLKFTLGGKEWQTATCKNNCNPIWENQSGDFIVCDHDQIIKIDAYDEDTGTLDGDDYLGGAQVTVGEVLLAGKQVTVDLHGGEHKGSTVTLQCNVLKLSSNLASLQANKNDSLLSGFLTILVTNAKNLPVAKEEASSFVRIKYGDHEEFQFVTPTVADCQGIDALNPVYDSVFHVPITPQLMETKDPVVMELVNGTEPVVLGSTTITHEDLIKANKSTITEDRAIGDKGASVRLRVSLQGVEEQSGADPPSLVKDGSVSSVKASATSSSVTHGNALGTVRLSIVKGWGFVAEKRRLKRKDIPDIYCNVTFGSSPNVWKTSTIKNSVSPEWNESSDYLLSDHGQMINLTVFDEDTGKGDEDDELGSTRITVGKLLLAGGPTDVELQQDGKPTGLFVSVYCEMVG